MMKEMGMSTGTIPVAHGKWYLEFVAKDEGLFILECIRNGLHWQEEDEVRGFKAPPIERSAKVQRCERSGETAKECLGLPNVRSYAGNAIENIAPGRVGHPL